MLKQFETWSRIQACCAKTLTQNYSYMFGLELSCLPLNKTQRKTVFVPNPRQSRLDFYPVTGRLGSVFV